MNITPINNYLQLAQARVLTQFKNKTVINNLLTIFINQIQSFETALMQVMQNIWIDTAAGVQLDGLGKIVGISRDGLTDDEYRNAIRIQIAINVSNGTPNVVINLLQLITGQPVVQLIPQYPASIYLWINVDTIDPLVTSTLNQILPAGVGFEATIGTSPFVFEGDINGFGLGSCFVANDPLAGQFVALI